MGNLNSCFDYNAIEKSLQALADTEIGLSGTGGDILNATDSFSEYDQTHDVLSSYLDTLSESGYAISDGFSELDEFYDNVSSSMQLYQNSEDDIATFLNDFSTLLKDNFGNPTVAGYITSGLVTADLMAETREDFIGGVSDEVKQFLTDYAMYSDDYYLSGYYSVEEWKNELIDKYTKEGYSTYDAENLAYAEMAKWRLSKTGAEVTDNAISDFATTQYNELQAQVHSEYKELVDKYQELGLDESQAKELATAESEYNDTMANSNADRDPKTWEHSVAKQKYDEWQALKEEYGVADAETTVTENNAETASTTSTSGSSASSTSTSSSGGSTTSNNYQYRAQSYSSSSNSGASTGSAIGSSSNNGGTSSGTPSETPSTPGDASTPSETPSTPETSTPSGENNGTSGPSIDEEVPTEETPSTGENTNTGDNNSGTTTTPPPTNTGESNTNTSPSTPPSSGNNNAGYVPFGNNNNNGNVSNAGGSFEDPGTPDTNVETPNENVATTTPSAPDSDAGIKDNSGETLDVISIDKDTTNSPSTSSNDGGSVIPAVLGVGVAGAAVAGGAKIIHDKKNKDEMYSYDDEESEEDNNSFSYLNSYDDSSETETQETPATKYRAGSANKLVLEDAPENINIEESATNIPGSGEELE